MTHYKDLRRAACAVVVPGVMLICSASHGAVLGELWQNVSTSISQDATIANKPSGSPDAEFNTSSINYNSTLTGYTPALFLNNPTFFNTSGTFNPNGSLDNTYFLFTGQTFLHAGANSFVTPHDDGFELMIPGTTFVSTSTDDLSQPGPTGPVSTPYTVNAPSAGLYDFTLSYGECCGPPAVLGFQINGEVVGTVPDVQSTMGLLGMACGLLGLVYRKIRS